MGATSISACAATPDDRGGRRQLHPTWPLSRLHQLCDARWPWWRIHVSIPTGRPPPTQALRLRGGCKPAMPDNRGRASSTPDARAAVSCPPPPLRTPDGSSAISSFSGAGRCRLTPTPPPPASSAYSLL
ncbi:hypothetical protein E2562_013888 [Oryza meyeriana var. granulata]|uniref:Uncharacterized protein n=1 Tax=Oryza meyeriana var. granulata TaxID=110450 RepID=A0A6G1C7K8_9ORYZ|nr:hypothetical protein E2562_013888 [Oryza meyeriana var. granulata]